MPTINEYTLHQVFSERQLDQDESRRKAEIGEAALVFANRILELAPSSPERSAALRDVQRAMLMAQAAINVERPWKPRAPAELDGSFLNERGGMG